MQLLDKAPPPPVYELTEQERACVVFSPEPQPGSQDSRNFENRRNSGSRRDSPRDDSQTESPSHDSNRPEPQLRDPRREDDGEQERTAELAGPAPAPVAQPEAVAEPVAAAQSETLAAESTLIAAAAEDDFGAGVSPPEAAPESAT